MSIVSAPEEVINQNELEALPVSRSEVEYRVSIPRRRKEFTEKGKAFLKSTRDKSRQKAFRNLMREANALKSKCNEQEIELEELEAGRDLIDSLKEKFNEAHRAYESTLEASPEKEESYRWFDVRDREFTECRMRICETMQSLERSSVASSKSRSVRSSCASKRSSHSSRKSSIRSISIAQADAAAEAAEAKIHLEFLDRENELKRVQLEKQYAIARAKEDTFKTILEQELKEEKKPEEAIVKPNIDMRKTNEVKQELRPIAPAFVPQTGLNQKADNAPHLDKQSHNMNFTLKQLVNLQAQQTELSSMLIEQQRSFHIPIKEPPIFSGDTFEYPAFVTAFDTIIAANVPSDKDRLFFLEKYTNGKANQVIKGFLATNSNTAYSEARSLLDRRFGNPVVVAEDYKNKLRSWKQINDGDSKSLQEFSDFLVRCEEAMKMMQSMYELDSTQFLQTLSAKLPSYSGIQWCRAAHEIQLKKQRLVGFTDFVEFVTKESELANDPLFSPDVLKRERKKNNAETREHRARQKPPAAPTRGQSLATATESNRINLSQQLPSAGSIHKQCPICDNKHAIVKCNKLTQVNADERLEIIKNKRLCFRCLSAGHVSAECKSISTCDKCSKRHHTFLHGSTPRPKSRDKHTLSTTLSSQDILSSSQPLHDAATAHSSATSVVHSSIDISSTSSVCRIVPVVLHHKSDPNKEIKTYALLDDASDTTFVTNEMKDKLGIEGVSTSLDLSTMHGHEVIQVTRIEGLVVERPDRRARVELPKAYTRDNIPSRIDQIPTPGIADRWQHLKRIRDKLSPLDESLSIGVLIGSNCPQAIKPKEVIAGKSEDPYAVKSLLGWCIVGPTGQSDAVTDQYASSICNRIVAQEAYSANERGIRFVMSEPTKELVNPTAVAKMFQLDFAEHKGMQHKCFSKEDRRFLEIAKNGIHQTEDGHYELPLPMRHDHVTFPNNKDAALRRLYQLKKRFENPNGEQYRKDYVKFMCSMIDNGYAELVPPDETSDRLSDKLETKPKVWFIPHHGLYHPKKGKFRCVFDCAATHCDKSLNKNLLQGPDLTNNLVGVLIRFRQEPVAFSCDIEGMFHQVKVNKECRDLLRFVWWPNGDTNKRPQEYRMTVHLFGATSSPGCANFALKTTADDNEAEFGTAAARFLRNDFYVDDGLKSVSTIEEAVELIRNAKIMCSKGGFHLHKFLSNNKEVIRSIPESERAAGMNKMDLDLDSLPIERTLGVYWCIESDCFEFRIVLQDKPCTRRGILSTVSSIFDPLGFVAPLLLGGKTILQQLCREDLGWDDHIPSDIRAKWERWRNELMQIQCISITRCYKPEGFGHITRTELHHFSDASTRGYGQCSYLRMMDEDGQIHCTFVMGKSRVTPLKQVTIPCLELTAAVCSTRISQQIHRESEYEIDQDYFWTDSKVVLGYINNTSKRFHVFVSNRVQEIRDSTECGQWRHVESKENPADEASRGTKAEEFKDSRWILGPAFLWSKEDEWPDSDENACIFSPGEDDPEVKKSAVLVTATTSASPHYFTLDERIERFSNWYRAKRAVATCFKYIAKLKARLNGESVGKELNVQDLDIAEKLIIRAAQKRAFKDEITVLISKSEKKKPHGIIPRLDAFIDDDGILRAGGRLKHATISAHVKHPVILPKGAHISKLIIRHFHERVSHQGKGITLNEIRSNGFWVIGGTSAVHNAIGTCIICRKLRGTVVEQKMSDLPEDRLKCCPPFTYCAVDYFGPFMIKEGRKTLKRYGVLFTCMSSRAIHLETATSLETDAFLNALRRFLSRRGPVQQIRSDQGTNFVGAHRELKEALIEMDTNTIKNELNKLQCDWITFKMNVPAASHMGGVWERQIRTVRSVLSSLLLSNGTQLDDDSLRTLMCEAESIVNCRPLTVNHLADHNSPEPLTPNHLLTMKSKVLLPPPGIFEEPDIYARKCWKRVQCLANQFWTRWRKEYMLSLQERNKWTHPHRNLKIDDIVLIKDENLPRNVWPLARVSEVFLSSDGKVRKVKLVLADSHLDKHGKRTTMARYLERPVQKLILLMSA